MSRSIKHKLTNPIVIIVASKSKCIYFSCKYAQNAFLDRSVALPILFLILLLNTSVILVIVHSGEPVSNTVRVVLSKSTEHG